MILVAFATILITEQIYSSSNESRARQMYEERVQLLLRQPATVYLVTDPGDEPDDSLQDGVFFPPTLRSAIQNANWFAGTDEIQFQEGIDTIKPLTQLPSLTQPVTIDGQLGAGGKLVLDGVSLAVNEWGVGVFAGGCVIKNLEIINFPNHGIQLGSNGGVENVIQGNLIHDCDGAGINLNFTTNNLIGGYEASERNKIYNMTGSAGNGMAIIANSNYNLIVGNWIGTEDGLTKAPNSRDGILLEAQGNVIANNLISGNDQSGISVDGFATSGNLIEANLIGTDESGTLAKGNTEDGIAFLGGSGDTVRYNVISGHDEDGIAISYDAIGIVIEHNKIGADTTGTWPIGNWAGISSSGQDILIRNNLIGGNRRGISVSNGRVIVQGNRIGDPENSLADLGNWWQGITINGGSGHLIGGPNEADRNIICYNGGAGVHLSGRHGNSVTVENNYIGVDSLGTTAMENWGSGVWVNFGHSNSVIKNNLISGNLWSGILFEPRLDETPDSNLVIGNLIGTDATGTYAIPNVNNGIVIDSASENIIGGLGDSANVICGHDSAGVRIRKGWDNEVYNNFIGIAADGLTVLPNDVGVWIDSGWANHIGADTTFGNLIQGNLGDGVILEGDSNFVEGNSIIRNGYGFSDFGGQGVGVYVKGYKNQVGWHYASVGNWIHENAAGGVWVDSGNGNTIAGNSFFNNVSLGIDLGYGGIAYNDTLDSDTGANYLQNYPLVDSGTVAESGSTIYVTLMAEPNQEYIVDYFVSDSSDPSNYGEGQRFVDTSVVTTDADGIARFEKFIAEELDTLKAVTMTASHTDYGTSEFSLCWPSKYVRVADSSGTGIPLKGFVISTVANDVPTLTETLVDTFETDSSGLILLPAALVKHGDSLRVSRILHTEESVKRIVPPKTAYSIIIDNADFEPDTWAMVYDEMDSTRIQEIKLEHTTVAFSLQICTEWDATNEYMDKMIDAMRQMSNYLYDVFDGQVRIDTVAIYDHRDTLRWMEADLWIYTTNSYRANSTGARLLNDWPTAKFKMPRRSFLNPPTAYELGVTDNPPSADHIDNWRTMAHEFGHYAFSFLDEYKEDDREYCSQGAYGFGFMQFPYGSGAAASEMSWSRHYIDTACETNYQYILNRGSCWEYFQQEFEKEYDGIVAPIIMPSERDLGSEIDWFSGPNEYNQPLNYDVGERMEFLGWVDPRTTEHKKVAAFFTFGALELPFPWAKVMHRRVARDLVVEQGLTSKTGLLLALGVSPEDDFWVEGAIPARVEILDKTNIAADDSSGWYSGTAQVDAGDTTAITLQKVNGAFPAVVSMDLFDASMQLNVNGVNPFTQDPSLEMYPSDGGSFSYLFSSNQADYQAQVSDESEHSGFFRILATDSAVAEFFFTVDYTFGNPSDSLDPLRYVASQARDGEFFIDSSSGVLNRVGVASTQYPTPTFGLSDGALRLGRVHALGIYPPVGLSGNSRVTIAYNDSVDNVAASEESIVIHKWNGTISQWEPLTSEVDTVFNEVSADITEAGVYAAFHLETLGGCCVPPIRGDVNDDGLETIDISDLFYLIDYMFTDGPAPVCNEEADLNADGAELLDIADLVYLVDYMFRGGPLPPPCP